MDMFLAHLEWQKEWETATILTEFKFQQRDAFIASYTQVSNSGEPWREGMVHGQQAAQTSSDACGVIPCGDLDCLLFLLLQGYHKVRSWLWGVSVCAQSLMHSVAGKA